jgi:hypothetical protein
MRYPFCQKVPEASTQIWPIKHLLQPLKRERSAKPQPLSEAGSIHALLLIYVYILHFNAKGLVAK